MPRTENKLLSNPKQFGNPVQLNYSTRTTPEQSIKALETMHDLAMLQTDVDLDAELRANLTFEKICINELLKSVK